MPSNYQSIVGGIFRGLNRNYTSSEKPLTRPWIGQETMDLRQPIEREQTQNPQLPWFTKSSGTAFEFTEPVPTDFGRRIQSATPMPDNGVTKYASSIGSMIQPMPDVVPIGNPQFNGYEMSPVNATHFRAYFANQINQYHEIPRPSATNILTAITEEQNLMTDGSADVWQSHMAFIQNRDKGYSPAQQFRG